MVMGSRFAKNYEPLVHLLVLQVQFLLHLPLLLYLSTAGWLQTTVHSSVSGTEEGQGPVAHAGFHV